MTRSVYPSPNVRDYFRKHPDERREIERLLPDGVAAQLFRDSQYGRICSWLWRTNPSERIEGSRAYGRTAVDAVVTSLRLVEKVRVA